MSKSQVATEVLKGMLTLTYDGLIGIADYFGVGTPIDNWIKKFNPDGLDSSATRKQIANKIYSLIAQNEREYESNIEKLSNKLFEVGALPKSKVSYIRNSIRDYKKSIEDALNKSRNQYYEKKAKLNSAEEELISHNKSDTAVGYALEGKRALEGIKETLYNIERKAGQID